jgi:hypothetical protein
MATAFHQFGHLLKTLLEQLAIRTEDGRLIYQDMSCMSWAYICDAPVPSGVLGGRSVDSRGA